MATQEERLDQQIASLKAKAKQIEARKQKIQAAKRASALKKERVADTRRKVLVGAFFIEQMRKSGRDVTSFDVEGKQFGEWLQRADDRALFKLRAVPVPIEQAAVQETKKLNENQANPIVTGKKPAPPLRHKPLP